MAKVKDAQIEEDKANERRQHIFEILSTIELEPSFLLVEAKLRNATQKVENGMLPPSDFFVLMQGDTKFPTGAEVILKPGALMSMVKDIQGLYAIETTQVLAHFPKK